MRYFLLGTHYRSPLDFSDRSLEETKNALNGFYDLLVKRLTEPETRATADKGLIQVIERCKVAFREAMDDDFNTSVAIAELQRLKSDVNKFMGQGLSTEARKIAREEFRSLGNVLGLFQLDKWQFNQMPIGQAAGIFTNPTIQGSGVRAISQTTQTDTPLVLRVRPGLADIDVQSKVDERDEARKQKDFKKADEIRQLLASHGIVIEDKPDGTSRWKR